MRLVKPLPLLCKKTKAGLEVLNNIANVQLILECHPEWKGVLAYNEFASRVEILSTPPWCDLSRTPRAWTDVDTTRFRCWLSDKYKMDPSAQDAAAAVESVANFLSHHPVRKWLDGLKWDGEERIKLLFSRYFGSKQDASYLAAVGRSFLISMVARIYEPGCKVDTLPVLEGAQGNFKSTALRILAGEDWFGDTAVDFGSKDAMAGLNGKWLVELAELGSIRGARSVETMKAFISSPVDYYRPAYGHYPREFPRQCVFAGTTNEQHYLADQTGNRRFWPVACGNISKDALRDDREQLFAEAVHAYQRGASWWLDSETAKLAADETEQRTEEDVFESVIQEQLKYVDVKKGVTISDILEEWLHISTSQQTKQHSNRIAAILRGYGWAPENNGRPRRYKPRP